MISPFINRFNAPMSTSTSSASPSLSRPAWQNNFSNAKGARAVPPAFSPQKARAIASRLRCTAGPNWIGLDRNLALHGLERSASFTVEDELPTLGALSLLKTNDHLLDVINKGCVSGERANFLALLAFVDHHLKEENTEHPLQHLDANKLLYFVVVDAKEHNQPVMSHRYISIDDRIHQLAEPGRGVRINGAINKDGDTLMHAAARHNADPEVFYSLSEYGWKTGVRNGDGETPLHLAAGSCTDATHAIRFFHMHDEGMHRRDAGRHPRAQFQIHARDRMGMTPLHRAVCNGASADIIRVLLDCGADINARDGNGWAALHHAAAFNTDQMIFDLLRAGAKDDVVSHDKMTAMQIRQLRYPGAAWPTLPKNNPVQPRFPMRS